MTRVQKGSASLAASVPHVVGSKPYARTWQGRAENSRFALPVWMSEILVVMCVHSLCTLIQRGLSMFVESNLSLQLRILRLTDVYRDFRTSEVRATAAFRQCRRLNAILQERLNPSFVIGARESFREEVNADGYTVTRWSRVIGRWQYSFIRVEDGNRNAYIDVVVGRNTVHTFRGKARGELRGIQVTSQRLGKLIQF